MQSWGLVVRESNTIVSVFIESEDLGFTHLNIQCLSSALHLLQEGILERFISLQQVIQPFVEHPNGLGDRRYEDGLVLTIMGREGVPQIDPGNLGRQLVPDEARQALKRRADRSSRSIKLVTETDTDLKRTIIGELENGFGGSK